MVKRLSDEDNKQLPELLREIKEEIEKKAWYRGLAKVGCGKNTHILPCIQITEEDWQSLWQKWGVK